MSRKALIAIEIILCLLFIAGVAVIIRGGATDEPTAPPQTASTASGDLRLSSQIAASHVIQGDSTEFWLQIENTGKAALTTVTLLPLEVPGFSVESCGCQSPRGACPANASAPPVANSSVGGAPNPPCTLLAPSLAPAQKLTIWIHLTAARKHSSEIFTAGVRWNDAANHSSTLAVPVGPVSIRTAYDDWIQSRTGLLQSLGFPLVTFILGAIFSAVKYLSDTAEKRADDERARLDRVAENRRARLAHLADEKRAQFTQTWNQMLPASHKLALGYYVPMVASVWDALAWLEKARPATQPAPAGNAGAAAAPPQWNEGKLKRAFYALMLFEARVRNTTVKVGGFYFKDRIGEKIVSRCYLRYRETFYRNDSAEQIIIENVRDAIHANSTLKDFTAAWVKHQVGFDDGWRIFQVWAKKNDGYAAAKPFLSAFRSVLDYEANRPYEFWYGSSEHLPLQIDPEAADAIRTKWPGFTNPAEQQDFQARIVKYLAANTRPKTP